MDVLVCYARRCIDKKWVGWLTSHLLSLILYAVAAASCLADPCVPS